MKLPKRRYIVSAAIFTFAAVDLYLAGGATWQTVGLVFVAAVTLLGAHAYDGMEAGPLSIDEDDENGGEGA